MNIFRKFEEIIFINSQDMSSLTCVDNAFFKKNVTSFTLFKTL